MKFCYTKTVGKKVLSDYSKQSAVAYKDSYWKLGQVLKIYFIDATPEQEIEFVEIIEEILKPLNLFSDYGTSIEESDIRISFKEGWGSYSYLGTDALFIPKDQETINIGWDGKDVMRHEFGHALNLLHEHQNPNEPIQWNEQVVIDALSGAPNYWSEEEIRFNVLDSVDSDLVDTTSFDKDSIMLYYFPSSWTLNNFETNDNFTLSEKDKSFLASKYPLDEVEETVVESDLIEFCKNIWTSKSRLNRMLEIQLVFIANSLGIEASVNDLKKETLDKVWNKIR